MVDRVAAKEILPYLHSHESIEKEFREIRELLKSNLRNRDKYCKCDVSDKAKDMFEMRFTRNNRNDRIYCKEIQKGSIRIIVMAELFVGKKTQHIAKTQKQRIENIGGYDYELEH